MKLKERTELNGRRAFVQSYSAAQQKYLVKLDGTQEQIFIKPCNLEEHFVINLI